MAVIDGKWCRMECDQMPYADLSFGIKMEKLLHKEISQYQEIIVFKSQFFGNVLVLDGTLQVAEFDEFVYHEMMANLPLNCHSDPKTVLVVGGGDGGIARELLKHHSVEKVVVCEIDEKVVDVCKKYFPKLSESFSDVRTELVIGDGIEYIKDQSGAFDVIITDPHDNTGAAKGLHEEGYYNSMKRALKPNGLICSEGKDMYFELPVVKRLMTFSRKIFPKVAYGYAVTPSYAPGHIGFLLCGTNPNTSFKEPLKTLTENEIKERKLKYYSSDIHRACFILPNHIRELQYLRTVQFEARQKELYPDGTLQQ
ncbi:spermidine synthase-like isoform X3 [Mytilus californianus]|nr:spermidine synthase-like isoform X3 [Mytilus californianus]XP_052076626.1 spermidine synthase-like isoform X3 [Mytilus californianus]XP_052076681.1 spermidine synthase-like isoform X3 [Mytilus californianus]